ncbi:intermembrane transport protein PqiB [Nitrospirillum amazonense]|uniref:Paraquat-inducible protein B n=1 Tax=Nitrospirillum amazonense TaxID=28077 RepID=A0A560K2F6_9PROT|nr:MlaD family protein [Nitrospirillum amazonense]MDG3443972.1 MlaD family protein [Nitrospirillum amazonense]TWB77533.1 paraquat-inducible protein B [Nitrospirillum amazonense]
MAETTPPAPHQDDLPEPVVDSGRRWIPSLVWLIPAIAAIVGLTLVVKTVWMKGPSITISFLTADGIEPGKTKVKFKDVDIGEVKGVTLTDDHARVLVTVELTKDAKGFAVDDSRFWVVRPRFAETGVSGLNTLLSGSYIGVDAGKSDNPRKEFTGLEDPPVVASDVPGQRYVLHTDDIGSLAAGSPVYYKRIPVGHVERYTLDEDGRHITLHVFIKSPYDHFITKDSKFWHASGVDVRIDGSGLKVDTEALATILMGGIAFEDPPDTPMTPAAAGSQFWLAANHVDAMKAPEGYHVAMVMRFHQSIRGLTVGAPVDFRGVEIGNVTGVGIDYDPATQDFTSRVMVNIFPDRLASFEQTLPPESERAARMQRLAELVNRGLRAQLRTGSFLTGQLYVAVDFMPKAPPVQFNPNTDPVELPTVPGDLEELYQKVQEIVAKLDKIPFDAIGENARKALASVDGATRHIDELVQHADHDVLPEIRDSLKQMEQTLAATQASVAPDAPLQQDTRQALKGVMDATRSLKALSDSLERHPESLVRGRKDKDE